jgi:ketosteroid isomerase-like protein
LPRLLSLAFLAACLGAQMNNPVEQVRRAEMGFARTMAERDLAAFTSFLADEALFVSQTRVLRGPKEVAAGWKRFFDTPEAPFSWEPDQVQVLNSGTLALSSGPVRDKSGKRIGTFNSIWRKQQDGKWKVLIDHGCPPCDCTGK